MINLHILLNKKRLFSLINKIGCNKSPFKFCIKNISIFDDIIYKEANPRSETKCQVSIAITEFKNLED